MRHVGGTVVRPYFRLNVGALPLVIRQGIVGGGGVVLYVN